MGRSAGYRTIVPYLCGYGPSTCQDPLSGCNPDARQPVAFAQDMIDVANTLALNTFISSDTIGAREPDMRALFLANLLLIGRELR